MPRYIPQGLQMLNECLLYPKLAALQTLPRQLRTWG